MDAIVDLQNLQKRFNLFAVGDVVKGTVFAINKDRTEIRTIGGCLGFVNQVYPNIKVGNSVEIYVDKIEEGIIYFQFTDEFLFFIVPQKGEVLFSGTQGTVVKFSKKRIGYFSSVNEAFTHLRNLPAAQKVSCRCRVGEPDCCVIEALDVLTEGGLPAPVENQKKDSEPEAESKQETSLFWTEEEKQNALDNGSLPRMGKLLLGFCYKAKVQRKENDIVELVDGSKAKVIGSRPCPNNGTDVYVRLVNIRAHARLFVEIIELSEAMQKTVDQKMEREFCVSAEFNFACSDKKVYMAGIKNHSEKSYGHYKLGMLYSVSIVDGKPDFQSPGEVEIETEVDANGYRFKENDVVFVRITHITLDMETKFNVRVEHVISC